MRGRPHIFGSAVLRSAVLRSAGVIAVATVVALVAASAMPAAADDITIARDISFPQCVGHSLPHASTAEFGVLGTNNGMSFTRNPCLVSQLAWAKRLPSAPAFYANTGNPGPARAKHWPLGQVTPKVCVASNPNSLGCSYDYGWNSAWQSYTVAVDAAQRLHHVGRANARYRAANVAWWLDVETMNSWQTLDGPVTRVAQHRDVATIAGEVDALHNAGVLHVGIYSTSFQWGQITGGSLMTGGQFSDLPVWLAGYESRADAVGGCNHEGFTGGPVRMTQFLGGDQFDANVVCSLAGD